MGGGCGWVVVGSWWWVVGGGWCGAYSAAGGSVLHASDAEGEVVLREFELCGSGLLQGTFLAFVAFSAALLSSSDVSDLSLSVGKEACQTSAGGGQSRLALVRGGKPCRNRLSEYSVPSAKQT